MPAYSDEATNFLHGLSDLWNRFFKDRDQLKVLYKANEVLVGQAYLDLMETVLNFSIREAPVFSRDFFKLLTVREDLITKQLDGRYAFDLTPSGIKAFNFLQNKVLAPTTILELDADFLVDLTGEEDLLLFSKNPFDWNQDGTDDVIPGVAYRTVMVDQGDGTTLPYRELAFWIPDCEKDGFNLYLNFGYLIQHFEPSSEAYRALIQGVVKYFTLGPTQGNLVSALNVIVGLPVVRDDGEYLLRVTATDTAQTVVTNARSYEFHTEMPLRSDILDPLSWSDNVGEDAALSFHSFEHLSQLFQIHDIISKWHWWFGKEIPPVLLPDEVKARRVISPELYENLVDNPPGLVRVGDPGLFIGADDDGFVPLVSRPTFRHLVSYVIFERFMRHHAFVMEIDKDVMTSGILPFTRLSSDLHSIIFAGKSAYTFLFTEQEIPIEDEIHLVESLLPMLVTLLMEDVTTAIDNEVLIGGGVLVGDCYTYTAGPPAGISITNPWPGWGALGKTPVVVGGADPQHFVLTELTDGQSRLGDWPVQITVT
jgi:hypothetical protein